MNKLLPVLLALILIVQVEAKVVTKEYSYKIDTTIFKGFVAYDDATKGKRPGVLVVHDWWGLGDFTKTETKRLAELGYVAFAADMYGAGETTSDFGVAAKLAGSVRGTPRMRQRVIAGYEAMLKQAFVDPTKTAAIGFCFGGTAVLELAYSGANVNAVATFHGGLFSVPEMDQKKIKARILVMHGADDPTMPQDTVLHFQESMRKTGADWQMIYFSNAVHAFSNPASGNDNSKGIAYNELAAKRSWKYMEIFFKEVFLGK